MGNGSSSRLDLTITFPTRISSRLTKAFSAEKGKHKRSKEELKMESWRKKAFLTIYGTQKP